MSLPGHRVDGPVAVVNRRRLSRIFAVTVLLAGAAPANGERASMPEPIVLTEAAQGRTLDVRVGQRVVADLPENASTGYRWAIDRVDPALVTVEEGTRRYPSAGAVGSGGRAEWIVTARAPGTTEVVLKRWRSWEGEAGVAERFRFGLQIAE